MKTIAAFLLLMPSLASAQITTTTIPIQPNAQSIAVNTVTNMVYVGQTPSTGSFSEIDNVTVINGATNATTLIPAAFNPSAIAVNTVTNKIYIANETYEEQSGVYPLLFLSLLVIDGATNTTTTLVFPEPPAVPFQPQVAVNEATNLIYIYDCKFLYVVNGTTNVVTQPQLLPSGGCSSPAAFAVNPITNMLYLLESGTLFVYNGETPNPTAAIPLGTSCFACSVYALVISTATNKVYVTLAQPIAEGDQQLGYVDVIDGAANKVISTLSFSVLRSGQACSPSFAAVNQVTNTIYVSCWDLIVIDGATNNVTADSATLLSNSQLAVNSTTNQIYILGSPLTVFDGATNIPTSIKVIPPGGPDGLSAMAVNPTTNTTYILNNTTISNNQSSVIAVSGVVHSSFSLASTPSILRVEAGKTASATITLTPSGDGITSPITITVDGLPNLATYSASPTTVTLNSSSATSVLTISTTAPTASISHMLVYTLALLLPLFVVKKRTLIGMLVGCLLLLSCGGGNTGNTGTTGVPQNPGTPAGTYSLTIMGNSASGILSTTNVTLKVQQ